MLKEIALQADNLWDTNHVTVRHHQQYHQRMYGVANKKTRDVLEMLGDFFREAAVLVTVFFPLDFALQSRNALSMPFLILICCLSLLLLIMGIALEKLRGR